eukprot:448808-Pyramimonas_sp.AAC.1
MCRLLASCSPRLLWAPRAGRQAASALERQGPLVRHRGAEGLDRLGRQLQLRGVASSSAVPLGAGRAGVPKAGLHLLEAPRPAGDVPARRAVSHP